MVFPSALEALHILFKLVSILNWLNYFQKYFKFLNDLTAQYFHEGEGEGEGTGQQFTVHCVVCNS